MTETAAPAVDRDRIVTAIGVALANVLEHEPPELTEDTRLFELGLDSTGVLELLLQLEDQLDAEFDTDTLEMAHFESVRALADFVTAELGG